MCRSDLCAMCGVHEVLKTVEVAVLLPCSLCRNRISMRTKQFQNDDVNADLPSAEPGVLSAGLVGLLGESCWRRRQGPDPLLDLLWWRCWVWTRVKQWWKRVEIGNIWNQSWYVWKSRMFFDGTCKARVFNCLWMKMLMNSYAMSLVAVAYRKWPTKCSSLAVF